MRTLNQNTLNCMQDYIVSYQKENGVSPSYRNIMHALDMSSLNLVQRYVLALEKLGRIQRTRLGNIELPKQLNLGKRTIAPLVGKVVCGQPVLSEQNIEGNFALPTDIFGDGKLFLLYAFGNSMIEAGIEEGDLLVVRQQSSADNGEIVVALVDGENTLKRFYRKGKKIILHPENKTMNDIELTECEIQGVLVSCIKKYN